MDNLTWPCPSLELLLEDGSSVKGSGEVVCTAVGDPSVRAILDGDHHVAFQDAQTVTGTTADGLSVSAEHCFVSQIRWDSSNNSTTVELTPWKCILSRPAPSPVDAQRWLLSGAYLLGRCEFEHAGHRYYLSHVGNRQDRRLGVISAALQTTFTGELWPVLDVLSLAQRSLVSAPICEKHAGDQLVSITLLPSRHVGRPIFPLIPWSWPALSSYLAQVLPAYEMKKADYELYRLIFYYCRSVQEPNVEVQFILASVVMEAFKFYWALNVAGKKPLKSASGLVKGFEKCLSSKGKPVPYEFRELLDEACASLGYSTAFTFVEDRNALFHTGAPGAYQKTGGSAWSAIKPELITLYKQIDDVLLTILGYAGPVLRWEDPNTEVAFP